ncbi:MAG: hypothetical protein ACOC14_00205 [Bacillota bacterium]
MDRIKTLVRQIGDTFTFRDLAEAFFGGLLLSTVVALPFLLVVINLGFLFITALRVFVVIGALILGGWAALWSFIGYKILRIRHPKTDIPLEKLRWIEAAIFGGILFIAALVIGLIMVERAF